jgi:hypothetical protein
VPNHSQTKQDTFTSSPRQAAKQKNAKPKPIQSASARLTGAGMKVPPLLKPAHQNNPSPAHLTKIKKSKPKPISAATTAFELGPETGHRQNKTI